MSSTPASECRKTLTHLTVAYAKPSHRCRAVQGEAVFIAILHCGPRHQLFVVQLAHTLRSNIELQAVAATTMNIDKISETST